VPDEVAPRGWRSGFSAAARCPRARLGFPRTFVESAGAGGAWVIADFPSATTPAAPARRSRRETLMGPSIDPRPAPVIVALALPSRTQLCSALRTVGNTLLDSNASG